MKLWNKGFELAGVSYDEFVDNFLKFIDPSIDHCKNTGSVKKRRAGENG